MMNPISRIRRLVVIRRFSAAAAILALAAPAPRAAEPDAVPKEEAPAAEAKNDLMEMDIEQLMKTRVTSVSRRSEPLSKAAAAIYVITQEDIRRSGVTSIPEALRLSPGLEVARQDAHTWAISSRGFNDEFANQLLVLVDGRSVYTPLFAGVYWDVQDLMLEDVDRIEVIRGPGATLWGANAVNGVINITTKSAQQTQGTLITGGAGTEERGFGAIRYGGKLSENGYYRVYGKYFNRDESDLRDGSDANDQWWMSRGGFRYDWLPEANRQFTLQGDFYHGDISQTGSFSDLTNPAGMYRRTLDDIDHATGGNLLAKWTQSFSANSELEAKIYYDRFKRERFGIADNREVFDADVQHHFKIGERNDLVWGLEYAVNRDRLTETPAITFDPLRRTDFLYSAFLQDQITLIEDRLDLTLGSKVEHNDYTGWEFQPSARLSLDITDRQTLWFAASRAVSTPSRAESDVRINQSVIPPGGPGNPTPLPVLVSFFGQPDIQSKELTAFELGYRIQPHHRVSLDLATFYNLYDKQRSVRNGALDFSNVPNYIVAPYYADNLITGETYGFELAATWQPADWWRVRANYTFWSIALHNNGAPQPLFEGAEHSSPHHQLGVRSLVDLPHNFELDAGLRYVDALSQVRRYIDPQEPGIPSYLVGDIRVGWRPNYNWEISLAAQNLFEARHQEFAPSYLQSQETMVETSVYAKVTYRF